MSTSYTVKSGDTLSGIAKNHGVKSWQDIYNHPDNAAFRRKRSNPNLIFPGDVLMIPAGSGPPPPTPAKDKDFIGFENEGQVAIIKADMSRARSMLDVVLRRLRVLAAIGPEGALLITPRSLQYYDAKLKVLNTFRVNTFRADDLPIPAPLLAQLRSMFRGFTVPSPAGSPADAVHFPVLLENFARLRRGLDDPFPKEFYTKSTFKGQPLGFFSAFVDATNLSDPTVRFTRKYFDPEIVDDDGRSVTIAHERAHTIFRASGHPGTGDNPFCVAPHLGDPNVTSFNQAVANPYCYEWLIYALQPTYNPGKHYGPECGA